MNEQHLQIAIDGGAASGKGSLGRRLAHKLGCIFIYTGGMYRALTYMCLKNNVSFTDDKKVIALLKTLKIIITHPDMAKELPTKVLVNGKDVTDKIFTDEINAGVSKVATIFEVRKIMVLQQQQMAKGKSVVMEGRDIGLRVLPHAQLKIYLTANLEDRILKRQKQLAKRGLIKSKTEIENDLKNRDDADMKRSADPLQKVPDAFILNTTKLKIDEAVNKVIQELKRRQLI